jgi:hypothetical protein
MSSNWCESTRVFGLKMMVKSGLEKNIFKFYEPLQSYCCSCPVQKNLPRKAELAWRLASISEGARGISKIFFLDHFSSSFLSKKW